MKAKLLLLLLFINSIAKAQTNPCDRSISASKFPEDTTIITPSGHRITMNRCEFFDVRNCITIRDLNDTSLLRQMNVTMQTTDGQRLLSSGMVQVSLDSCASKKLEIPMVIRIKVNPSPCSPISSTKDNLYEIQGNKWIKLGKDNMWFEKIDGMQYMSYRTSRGTRGINCDRPLRNRNIKIKVPNRYKIEECQLFIQSPTFFDRVEFEKLKSKVKVRPVCTKSTDIKVQLRLWNKKTQESKDTIVVLEKLQHGVRKLFCDEKKVINLGFLGQIILFRHNKNYLHRKYFLKII